MDATDCRRSSADRTIIEATLGLGDPRGPIQPTPAERPLYIGGAMSPPPKPDRGHVRPMLFAARPGNRLSLSLPVQVGEGDLYRSTRHTPTTSDPSTRQPSPAAEIIPALSPKDSDGFLVALAAQERRVLELKEELCRAEGELKKLKKQWAIHEANRNTGSSRVEIKHMELRPMQRMTPGVDGTGTDNEEDIPVRRSVELDRRRAILAGMTKDSHRKVITGGHTRALSLLSPVRSSYGQNQLSSSALDSKSDHASPNIGITDKTQHLTKANSNRVRNSYQDSATIDVKQIAEDLKSGLWTFMEDLRQATVGDEATKGTVASTTHTTLNGPVKKGSKLSPVTGGQGLNGSNIPGKWASKGQETRTGTDTALAGVGELKEGSKLIVEGPVSPEKRLENDSSLDDDWSNWDSPVSKRESGRWSNSTALSSQDSANSSSLSNGSMVMPPVLPVNSTAKREEVPWPSLNNFTPSNLKRTASAIMKEWEKSLTPPPKDRKDPMSRPLSGKKTIDDQESRLLLNNLP